MLNITCDHLDPYADSIATFIKREFPVLAKTGDMLDLLTDAIIASGQVRFGPKPSPESLVAIREIITLWTSKKQPIPFLIGWGSEKPDGSGIDIAEVMAMKTLSCLQHRVQQYYTPGVQFAIRVEDASAPHLFFDRQEQARIDASRYTSGFLNLAKVLGISDFVKIIPESSMISEETFNRMADEVLPAMEAHVNDPMNNRHREVLFDYGWKIPLSQETIGYYLDRYQKLYPELNQTQRNHLLARYFAGALSRHTLGITGANKAWDGKFLELSFVAPTPGIGVSRAMRRIYYRTMPCNITTNHMPAWRAKGYLKINGEVTSSLTSFHNKEFTFNPHVITLEDGELKQDVQADYIVV